MTHTNAERTHTLRWRFFRAGGSDQVRPETGADLVGLDTLARHCGSPWPLVITLLILLIAAYVAWRMFWGN